MTARHERLRLRDGSEVVVRPIAPEDKELLQRGLERLSPESRYRRFFTPMDRLGGAMLTYLTEVDHRDHEALVALEPETGQAVAVARYVRARDEPEAAEAAVTVVDDWHGRGLGSALLDRLAERARQAGIFRFTALVQAENLAALRMLGHLGDTQRTQAGTEVELRIELPERGAGAGLREALRAAAAGSIVVVASLAHRAMSGGAPSGRRAPVDEGPIETVVAGTDGSPGGRRAARTAMELAALLGAGLHLVSAYNAQAPGLLRGARGWVPDDVSQLSWVLTGRPDADAVLADAQRQARALGLRPTTHPCPGEPAAALIAVAERVGADLIVVGDKGMGTGARFLLGSVGGKLSHHAPCSVLIVRGAG